MMHECSIHGTLWCPAPIHTRAPITHARNSMLHRSLTASQTFARTLLAAPSRSYNHFTFPVWSAWFYSTLLVMKIVAIQQAGGNAGSTRADSVPHTVGELLPQDHEGHTSHMIGRMTSYLEHASLRDENTTAVESELIPLLETFVRTLKDAAPQNHDVNDRSSPRSFLLKVTSLQEALLKGIQKMMSPSPPTSSHAQQEQPSFPITVEGAPIPQVDQHTSFPDTQQAEPRRTDHDDAFDFGLFDNSAMYGLQEPPLDSWLWDVVMNDGNMFTI